jgi:colicin import membrane protein|tara:strand:+ start:1379 stop:2077 length:699 start_codon:yes stop_codon:yes gene_type:complete
LLFALVIHAGLGYALYQGWTPDTEVSSVITPKVVSAKLIILEPKARPKRQVTPKPMPTKPSVVKKPTPKKPDLANEAKAAAEKAAKVEKAEQKAKEARLEQQRLARLAALGELAQANLEQDIDEEVQNLNEIEDDEAAQSFRAAIYEQVRKSWSRPPSARNGMQALLLVELIPTGEVISVTLIEGSGNSAFDQSAEQAIRQVRRFDVPTENSTFEKYFRRFYFLFQPSDLLR